MKQATYSELARIFSAPESASKSIVIRVAEQSDLPVIHKMYDQAGVLLTDTDAEDFVIIEQEEVFGVIGMRMENDEGVMLPVVIDRVNWKPELLKLFIAHAGTTVSTLRISLQDIGMWPLFDSAAKQLGWMGFEQEGTALVKRFKWQDEPRKVLYDTASEKHYGGTGWRRWAK